MTTELIFEDSIFAVTFSGVVAFEKLSGVLSFEKNYQEIQGLWMETPMEFLKRLNVLYSKAVKLTFEKFYQEMQGLRMETAED